MNTTETIERPMIFSAPMVRALKAGVKTQTRRIVKPEHASGIEVDDDDRFAFMHSSTCGGYCDYGCAAAGEVLDGHIGWTPWGSHPERRGSIWVREAFWHGRVRIDHRRSEPKTLYRADGVRWPGLVDRWRSPIHMPRRYARLLLTITRVRVQRLHEISIEDAIAEGAPIYDDSKPRQRHDVLTWFEEAWNAIHGDDAWGVNPWVWAITFEPKAVTP